MDFLYQFLNGLENDIKEDVLDSINDDFLYSVPNLNVKKFKNMLEDHLSNKADYPSHIWRLYIYPNGQSIIILISKNINYEDEFIL